MEDNQNEIKNFIKVWILAFISLSYCYFIPSKLPKGKFRFLSLLPIFYFFIILPLNLTTISLGGITGFFLPWLANFNLILFSFGKGPLSSSSSSSANPLISFLKFISNSCLPIKIKQNPSLKTPNSKSSSLNFAIKGLILALVCLVYEQKDKINPKLMYIYYCCFLYLSLELLLAIIGAMASILLNVQLEPQFNEPFLSTSLQDFWGKRWNLMVPNILRPTVYDPVLYFYTVVFSSRKWAPLLAVLATFVVSGLMHELIFYYFSHVTPTWEVTCFFLVQGVCVAIDILVKKLVNGRWRLHPVVSGPLTVSFVIVTGAWLFFPPLGRCDAFGRVSREVTAAVGFAKEVGLAVRSFGSRIFK